MTIASNRLPGSNRLYGTPIGTITRHVRNEHAHDGSPKGDSETWLGSPVAVDHGEEFPRRREIFPGAARAYQKYESRAQTVLAV